MGIKRIVDVSFWTDDKVMDMFSPEDKLFMLYLLTNPHTTQLGVYAINVKQIAFEIGYSSEAVQVLIERFESKYKMIKYSKNTKELAVKNYLKHSIIKGGKPVEDLLLKEIKQVKDKGLLQFVYDNINDCETLNDTVKKILENLQYENEIQNDNDNDNDNEVSYHDTSNDTSNDTSLNDVKQIIDYLNQRICANYRYANKETQKHIKARLKEGYTVEQFIDVIDKKANEWLGTEMEKYLRPNTLFGSKFENYYNAPVYMKKETQYGTPKTGARFADLIDEL